MPLGRLKSLMHRLTHGTAFADVLAPVERALARVRTAPAIGRTLNMADFIALRVLRHLQGMTTLCEQVQGLWHLEANAEVKVPLARSTWSDALASGARGAVLENEGVVADLRITLSSSRERWRLVTFRTRRGRTVEFLTNDFSLLPGVVAFLYSRRWDEEKCFDTWKNDFAQAKAWGKCCWTICDCDRTPLLSTTGAETRS